MTGAAVRPYPHETFRQYFERRNGKMSHIWGDDNEMFVEVQLRFMDTMADFVDGLKDRVGSNEMAAALSRGGGHGY
jgi:hypothetical protein